jgi:parallel beta-helix repeat protein
VISYSIIELGEISIDSSIAFAISNNTIKNSFAGITMSNHSSGKVFLNHFYNLSSYCLMCYSSATEIYNNIFSDTLSTSINIRLDSSDCHIYGNEITGFQGIHIDYNSNPLLNDNLFHDISLDAIVVNNASFPIIYNNTVVNCRNGIFLTITTAVIRNNILTGCSWFGIKELWVGGPPDTSDIAYNNVYRNALGNYIGGAISYGNLVTINSNGDSCDRYYNISLDPEFIGGEPFDYNLALGSPCIDAGTDVGFPYFGDAPDIGAFESNYTRVADSDFNLLPLTFNLEPCYPNPFNQTTTINFALPKRALIKIAVYNILGEQFQIIQEGYIEAGYHRVNFDAGECSSGLYFVKMTCPQERFERIRKMLLIK